VLAAAILLAGAVVLVAAANQAATPLHAITWGSLAMAASGYSTIWVIAAVRGPGCG